MERDGSVWMRARHIEGEEFSAAGRPDGLVEFAAFLADRASGYAPRRQIIPQNAGAGFSLQTSGLV